MPIVQETIMPPQAEFGFMKSLISQEILKKYPNLDVFVEEKIQEYEKKNKSIGENIDAFVAGVIYNYGDKYKKEAGRVLNLRGDRDDRYQDIKESIILLLKEKNINFNKILAEKSSVPGNNLSSEINYTPEKTSSDKGWLTDWQNNKEK